MPSYMESFYLPSMLLLKLPIFLAGMLSAIAIERSHERYGTLLATAVVLLPLPNAGDWKMCLYRGIYVSVFLAAVTFEGGRYRGLFSSMGDRLVAFSKHRIFVFLAETSYGVYLIHALVLPIVIGWLVTQGLDRAPRVAAALALSVPLSYSLAWIFHIYVETPGISFGRRLLKRRAKKSSVKNS